EDSSIKNKKSYALLQTSKSKLKSIANFENKILNTKENYKALIAKANNQDCLDRTKLINQIANLNTKYSLFEPIFVRISRQFNNEATQNYASHVKVNHYEIKIAFKSKDHVTMLMICNELYKMLPYGSIVTETSISKHQALTPDIISKLNTKNAPGLLEVKMKIQLREIVYEH
ncbi:MAG: hypothetical protein AAF673_05810, partial [Pseudomonadota bacterium]